MSPGRRIIYPDASSLDLGKMPGADEGGFAGFNDQVDDHFLKVFGNAILLSVVSAGVQLSQGNANNQTSGLHDPADHRGGAWPAIGPARPGDGAPEHAGAAHARNPSRLSLRGHGHEGHRAAPLGLARNAGRALRWRWVSAPRTGPCSRFAALFLGLVSSLFAIEPGFLLMPLLAILLPRFGVPAGADGADRHRDRARAARSGVDRWASGLLPQAERRRVAWLSPAILAAGFFGASLVPLCSRTLAARRVRGHSDDRSLATAGLDRGNARRDAATKADAQPFAAILKSARLFPLWHWLASFGRHRAGESGLDPDLGSCRDGGSSHRTSGLQGLRGLRLHARALCHRSRLRPDGASCGEPCLGKEPLRSRLRLLAVLAVVSALLAAPSTISGTRKTAFAALAPGLCRASPSSRLELASRSHARSGFPPWLQRFGPRRGLAALQAKAPSLDLSCGGAQHRGSLPSPARHPAGQPRSKSGPLRQSLANRRSTTKHAQALTHALLSLRRHGARPARRRSRQCDERNRWPSHGLGGERLARSERADPRHDRKSALR